MKRLRVDITEIDFQLLLDIAKDEQKSVATILGDYAKSLTSQNKNQENHDKAKSLTSQNEDQKNHDKVVSLNKDKINDLLDQNRISEIDLAKSEGLQAESINRDILIGRVNNAEPSQLLEDQTIKNLIMDSIVEVQNHLDDAINRSESLPLTRKEAKELFVDHLKNLEQALEKYIDEKSKGVSWKDRISSFKDSISKAYRSLVDNIKMKLDFIKQAPINLKNNVTNRVIDKLVDNQNKIIDKANYKIENLEAKRPENKVSGNSDKSTPSNGKQLLTDYKTEYKKHLISNFAGNENQEINKALINHLDSQLVSKPHLSLQLRQEALFELQQEFLDTAKENPNFDVSKFMNYLNDKSELLAHSLKFFDQYQQQELLNEDLKYEKYVEPVQSLEVAAINEKKSEQGLSDKYSLDNLNEIKNSILEESGYDLNNYYVDDEFSFNHDNTKGILALRSKVDPGWSDSKISVDLKSGQVNYLSNEVTSGDNWAITEKVDSSTTIDHLIDKQNEKKSEQGLSNKYSLDSLNDMKNSILEGSGYDLNKYNVHDKFKFNHDNTKAILRLESKVGPWEDKKVRLDLKSGKVDYLSNERENWDDWTTYYDVDSSTTIDQLMDKQNEKSEEEMEI